MPLFLLTWPAEHQAFCRTLRLRSLLCCQGFMTPAFNDYFESRSFSLWCVWKKLNEKPAAQSCFDLRLFDLVFKALLSTDHLQLVTLLLLIIILSPSGFLLCPKHRVLFRTNNVTWQRATAPTLFSPGFHHRAEGCTCAGGDHVAKWRGWCMIALVGPLLQCVSLCPSTRVKHCAWEQPIPGFFLLGSACMHG